MAIVDGATGGLASKAQELANAAAEMGRRAIGALKEAINSHSPSKEFYKVGQYMPQGAALGVIKDTPLVEKASANMGYTAMSAFHDAVSKNPVDGVFDDLGDPVIRPVVDMTNVKTGAAAISSLIGGAVDIGPTSRLAAKAYNPAVSAANQDQAQGSQTILNYNQQITSPKALSHFEIYRQTQNQLSTIKGALGL